MAPGLPGITAFVVPLDLNTLRIIWPTAISVAFVGLLETLLTAKLVDDLTDTRSHKGKESWALGVANIAAGFYGGIGGCAMIAQTIVNVKIGQGHPDFDGGRRHRAAGAGDGTQRPDGADPDGRTGRRHDDCRAQDDRLAQRHACDAQAHADPGNMVMGITVAVTVITGNLAIGIAVGVMLAMVLFARRVAHVIRAERTLSADGMSVRYDVHGPLFFGSSNDLVERFAYGEDPKRVLIDLTHSQIWDASSVAALDRSKPNTATTAPPSPSPGSTSAAPRFTSG